VAEGPDVAPGPGEVFVSPHPNAGATAWHIAKLHSHGLGNIACPSHSLCFVSQGSSLFASTDAAARTAKWTRRNLGFALSGISCPSPSLCVGVAGVNVFIGTPQKMLPG
jgi:hypothetical protein